jgi:hypothetical protein
MLCRARNVAETLTVMTEVQRGAADLPGDTGPASLPKITGDFDFLVGTWTVAHRTRSAPLTGSDKWSEFSGPMQAWTHFNGAVSIDEFHFPHRGTRALTVRLFDPKAGTWSIYWVSSIDGGLQKPVHGGFDGNVGYFYGDDEFDGHPIRIRYIWTDLGPRSARWEQAFSPDGGSTWETNWVMELTRTASRPGGAEPADPVADTARPSERRDEFRRDRQS